MRRTFRRLFLFLAGTFILVAAVFCYFFVGQARQPESITWGIDFSQMQAESLKLDWKKAYSALIDDLGAKNIKLHTQWDWVEGKRNDYFFDDIDWQIKTAREGGAKIIYVVGMKTGRWPECHIPKWAEGLSKAEQQDEILEYIKKVVLRYKDSSVISYWQVENEPLFPFGECPWSDKEFLKKEVELVKLLDPSKKVIVSDSGEQSMWFSVAKIGDVVGTTMYRKVWMHFTDKIGFNLNFNIPPVFYSRKALLINKIFGKKVVCIELQAEPWASRVFTDVPLKEQEKTMNLSLFLSNVEYARKTGLDTMYFWGAEWWYWLKTTQNQPQIWNEAKKLF